MSWDELEPSQAQLDLLEDLGSDEDPSTMEEASELIDDLLTKETAKERKERFKKRSMLGKPPSQKQLNYLASLGVREKPASMWQASQWINEVLELM